MSVGSDGRPYVVTRINKIVWPAKYCEVEKPEVKAEVKAEIPKAPEVPKVPKKETTAPEVFSVFVKPDPEPLT